MIKETHYSLLSHNTFGIEAYAEEYVEFSSEEELVSFFRDGNPAGKNYWVVGAGSNLLFCGNYPGTLLHSAIQGIEKTEDTSDFLTVRVGSGMLWDDFVAYCVQQGWGGVENLSGIPGEVGASAIQNIGAYGAEVSESIVSVEGVSIADGSKRSFTNAECRYAYRYSAFKDQWKGEYFITCVTYRLSKAPQLNLHYAGLKQSLSEIQNPTLADVRNAVIALRKEKLPDPAELGNAGSFFMNPVIPRAHYDSLRNEYPDLPCYEVDESRVKLPAGWLIERCGWKGKSVGRAGVHHRQALILVNLGGATAGEIVHLASLVCESVHTAFGIDLHPEVNYVH